MQPSTIARRRESLAARLFAVLKNESGATAVEYALIAAIIGGVIVASFSPLSNSVKGTFTTVGNTLDDAG